TTLASPLAVRSAVAGGAATSDGAGSCCGLPGGAALGAAGAGFGVAALTSALGFDAALSTSPDSQPSASRRAPSSAQPAAMLRLTAEFASARDAVDGVLAVSLGQD